MRWVQHLCVKSIIVDKFKSKFRSHRNPDKLKRVQASTLTMNFTYIHTLIYYITYLHYNEHENSFLSSLRRVEIVIIIPPKFREKSEILIAKFRLFEMSTLELLA